MVFVVTYGRQIAESNHRDVFLNNNGSQLIHTGFSMCSFYFYFFTTYRAVIITRAELIL